MRVEPISLIVGFLLGFLAGFIYCAYYNTAAENREMLQLPH